MTDPKDETDIEKPRRVVPTLVAPSGGAATPDTTQEDALLGEILVRAGLLSRDVLDRVVDLQKDIVNLGVPLRLAEVIARRGLVFTLYHAGFHLSVIVSPPMTPTLLDDVKTQQDWVLSERFTLWFRGPHRWEVLPRGEVRYRAWLRIWPPSRSVFVNP